LKLQGITHEVPKENVIASYEIESLNQAGDIIMEVFDPNEFKLQQYLSLIGTTMHDTSPLYLSILKYA
jgi:hypothetical protein